MKDDFKKNIEKEIPDLLKGFIDRFSSNSTQQMYTGKVEDNNDPDQLGRCKVRVFGWFDNENISTNDLPWAKPEPHLLGNFIIPEVGSLVRIYFDHNSIYNPIYTASTINTNQISSNVLEDYPNNKLLFETKNGDFCVINTSTFEFQFRHSSGLTLTVDVDGNIDIKNNEAETGNLNITVKGDVSVESETGDITVTASKGSVNLGTNANVPCPNVQNCVVTGTPLAIGRNFNGTPGSVKVPL